MNVPDAWLDPNEPHEPRPQQATYATRAACSCGWLGQWHRSRPNAVQNDHANHLLTVRRAIREDTARGKATP